MARRIQPAGMTDGEIRDLVRASVDEITVSHIGAAPEVHEHDAADIVSGVLSPDRLPVHSHTVADIDADGTPSAETYLRGDGTWDTVIGDSVGWDDILDKPVGYPPSPHNHPITDVTGLQSALNNKADVSALDNYSPATHNHDTAYAALAHTHAGVYEPAFAAGTTAQYRRGDKTWQTLDKAAVGLSNVDNTSDASKPISTATQTALNAKADVIYVDSEVATRQPLVLTATTDTSASTGAKVLTASRLPVTGDLVRVVFTSGNTAANLSFNINGSGAKAVRIRNTDTSALSSSTGAGGEMFFHYDGTYFHQIGSMHTTNSSYSEITSSEITAGTANSMRTISGRRAQEIVVKAQTTVPTPTLDADAANKLYVDTGLADKAATSHTHDVSDLTATGTRDSTTILYGDNTWKTAPSGGSGGVTDHTLLTNIGTNTHAQIDTHIASTSNPHSVTKAQVGLGNVDNTSDANKPISTAVQAALDNYSPVNHNHPIADVTGLQAALDAKVADNLYYNVMNPAHGPVAVGDGVTDDWGAIQHRLDNLPTTPNTARGGKVVLEPGREYGISQTLTITLPNTDLDGIVGGTLTTMGACTVKALPGFTGPLIRVNIPSGSKGAWIRNLRLDANNEPGVTAGIEFADGTVSVANVFDVAIYGGTGAGPDWMTGLKFGSNCQSIFIERVLAAFGLYRGVDIGANNRHIVFRDCRIGGWDWAVVAGVGDKVSANRTQTPIFDGCELYAMTAGGTKTPQGVVVVRNTDNARLTNCYIEVDAASPGVIPYLVLLGNATSTAYTPTLIGNRFGHNAKAQWSVEIFDAVNPVVLGNGNDRNVPANGGQVKWSQAVRSGVVQSGTGNSVDSMTTPHKSVMPAGYDAFQAWVDGEAYPRVYVRNNLMGIGFGNGSAPADVFLFRGVTNQLVLGTGDSLRVDGVWNGGRLQLGTYNLWVDDAGKLRMKNGAPTSDTDGAVVGVQT